MKTSRFLDFSFSCLIGLSIFVAGCGGGGSSGGSTGTTYTVGGTLSGLADTASVTVQNNGGDSLTLTSNATFAFSTQLASGAAYNVTVSAQPSGQLCTVSNGSGTVASANVTNISVTCQNAYTIGGTLSGLTSGSVVLNNNGGDAKTLSAIGAFTFTTPVASGGTYSVTVATQPSGQTCNVSNGSGTVASANVTNVSVTCGSATYTYTSESVLYAFGTALNDPGSPYAALYEGSDGMFYATTEGGGTDGRGALFKFDPTDNTITVLKSFDTAGTLGHYPVGRLVWDGSYFYGLTSDGGTTDNGTLFRYDPGSGNLTVLHNFAGQPTDGDKPRSSMVLSGTTLYGATCWGGASGYGALFKYDLSGGTYTMIHSFTGAATANSAGDCPTGLIMGGDGNLYGITQFGGTYDNGVLYKVALPAETVTVVHYFDLWGSSGTASGTQPYGDSLVRGASANLLYGTTIDSSPGAGLIYSFDTSSNTFTVLHELPNTEAEGASPQGSMVVLGGYLYGTTHYGGTSDNGVAYKLNLSTNGYTVLHVFGAGSDGMRPNGVVLGSDNKLYGTTYIGGSGSLGTVFVLQ